MLVQVGLCQTCSETTLLVFPRGGSYLKTLTFSWNAFNFFFFFSHYENLPMQYTENFSPVKIENFMRNNIFNIIAQNVDCGYMLELPQRGSSNRYPQSIDVFDQK